MTSRIQKVVTKFRADLIAKESAALDALDTAYAHTLSIIEPVLDILYVAMQEKIDAGEAVPVQWLYENRRLRIVQDQVRKQIDHFGALSLAKAGELQHYAVRLGQDAAQMMLGATVPAGVEWSFGVASPKAIANILGATQSGSPLADLFDGFGAEAAQKAGDALVTGVSLGWNPRDIAPFIEDALNISRNRALTIARDQAMRGYREAALETYQANSDVVGKWRWTCSLSTRTCAACIAMDGTLHNLDDPFGSHVNCRCSPVPVTRSWQDILSDAGIDASDIPDSTIDMQRGEDWFKSQSEDDQRKILGNAKYDAYADGKFELSDIVKRVDNADWGPSIQENSLKELLS